MVCIDEEIPFEIPAGWEWCRIREISQSYIGLTYNPGDVSEEGTIVLRSSNIKNGKLILDDIVRVKKDIPSKLWVETNDILICARNGSAKLVGKSAIIPESNERMTFGAFMAICKTALYEYVFIFLQSDLFFGQLRQVSGTTTINQLTQNNFNGFLIPVPPLEEQKRIANKLSIILPEVEKYSKAQDKLDSLNYSLSKKIQQAILQEAIQGRLVPQDPNDVPASILLEKIALEKQGLVKEGKIKPKDAAMSIIFKGEDNKYYEKIGNDTVEIDSEIPFDIPASWTWCRLSSICSFVHRGKSPKYSEIKKIPVIAQKCNQWDGFHIEKAQFIEPNSIKSYAAEQILQNRDLLWNSTGLGTLGRMAMYESSLNPYGIAVADSHVTIIRAIKEYVLPEYLFYYFTSPSVQNVIEDKSDGSTKQKELATKTVLSYLIPVPPLAEQEKITQKIQELFAAIR